MALADLLDPRLFRPRNLIPVGAALVVGAGVWLFVQSAVSDAPAPVAAAPAPVEPQQADEPPPPKYPSVLVAKRPMGSGVLLVSDLVEWREWREPLDLDLVVVQDVVPMGAVLGAVTMRHYREGELIAWDGLITPGSPGFITAVLEPGHRAVTVEVDRATTNANIIYPGDRVDVIMVAGGEGPDAAAQSIVHDVRVLAVGSTIVALGRYGKASVTSVGAIDPVDPPAGETYTLEVGPKDAERISLAANTGRLTLAIRSILAAPEVARGTLPVRMHEVMTPVAAPPVVVPQTVRVIRGGGEEETVTVSPAACDCPAVGAGDAGREVALAAGEGSP